MSYRERKEAFVSDLHGATLGTLVAASSLLPLGYAAVAGLCLAVTGPTSPPFRSPWRRFALEFSVLFCASTLALTAQSPQTCAALALVCTALVWLAVIVRRGTRAGSSIVARSAPDTALPPPPDALWSVVSAYRGSIMLLTSYAILGVDFPVFLRSHCKTEWYGCSLMDLGVGAVVTASALTSKAARGGAGGGGAGGADEPARTRSTPLYAALSTLSQVAVPSLLGVLRLAAHRAVDYQHHVSEYGAHWNFYWTVAVITVAMAGAQVAAGALLTGASAVRAAVRARGMGCGRQGTKGSEGGRTSDDDTHGTAAAWEAALYAAAAAVVVLSYQVLLRSPTATPTESVPGCLHALSLPPIVTGQPQGGAPHAEAASSSTLAPSGSLEAYILCAPRTPGGFLASNREGVYSCAGYLALHLLGLAGGRALCALRAWAGQGTDAATQSRAVKGLALGAACVAGAGWAAYAALSSASPSPTHDALHLASPPSRRLANAPYVALSLALNATQMVVYALTGWAVVSATRPRRGSTTPQEPGSRHARHDASHAPAPLARTALRRSRRDVARGAASVPASPTPASPPPSTPKSTASSSTPTPRRRRGAASPMAQPRGASHSPAASARGQAEEGVRPPPRAGESHRLSHPPSTLHHPVSLLLEAVNTHFFPFFLAANLLTGVVNGTVWTLDTPDAPALAILCVQQGVLCAGAVAATGAGARLRLKL